MGRGSKGRIAHKAYPGYGAVLRPHSFQGRHPPKKKEDFAYILDIYEAQAGIVHTKLVGDVAQLLGEKHFTFLEGLIKAESEAMMLERVYIGSGPREKISAIIRKIGKDDLTSIAKAELENAIERVLAVNERRWTEFFNKAGPITKKLHSLDLLPGIGKKTMWSIIQEREKRPFKSFKDISDRLGLDPMKLIAKRTMEELDGSQKYFLFVDPYREEPPTRASRRFGAPFEAPYT